MHESIRIECLIGIELIYNDLTKIWIAPRKIKCIENILSTMEELYDNQKQWMIEVIGLNQFARLYEGTLWMEHYHQKEICIK